ncbi:response regulator [Novosphingobium sp. HK4-1]|uniref:Response regulator n=2 Tax=Novosphingobium mangrovi (ex Huang et al. 2023) TaxID=2976432 RepID=A0ABT2I0L8_9SPHN|nr:response regulator [Novosphingobium mangrovi (ex Huang et al. 2023)]MCT2398346.1 response regulator [Novosphingobium mangrovi (ex Huang et al. 2023)]
MAAKLVHIIDDEEAIRKSTSFMLKVAGYQVETWESGVAFLKNIKDVEEGAVLLDVRMPDMDGLEVQAEIAAHGALLPVVILTGHGDVNLAVRAMKAGAVDFIEKPVEKEQLIGALERALEKLEGRAEAARLTEQAEVRLAALTAREREVLDGLAKGFPNKTIAYDLGISPRTVEVYRANVMTKLDVRSFSEALRIAFAAGLG